MMHMAASNAILQLTDRQGKMNAGAVINTMKAAWSVGKPLVTRGRVVLGLAKETVDRAQEQKEDSSASASGSNATAGDPMGDPDDEEGKGRKTNCEKSESTVWKELKPYRGEYRTNTKGDEIYKWDHLHNDIEVFSKRGEYLGSMDPRTGILYKGPKGHSINL
jgi:hypothetical protein